MGTITKSAEIPASPDDVWATVTDPARFGDWQTIHTGFTGDPPTSLEAGTTFTQKVTIMGMPGEVKWTVEEAEAPSKLALSGEGPMGTTLKAGYTLAGSNGSTDFTYETEFGGPALAAMEATLDKESEKAAEASLEKLKGLF